MIFLRLHFAVCFLQMLYSMLSRAARNGQGLLSGSIIGHVVEGASSFHMGFTAQAFVSFVDQFCLLLRARKDSVDRGGEAEIFLFLGRSLHCIGSFCLRFMSRTGCLALLKYGVDIRSVALKRRSAAITHFIMGVDELI